MKKRYVIKATVYSKLSRITASAQNSYKQSHPLQKFFAEQVGQPQKIYLHAEIKAMIQASIHVDKLHSIYIKRQDEFGNLYLAKPCIICVYAMIFFGIEHVSYSISNEETWYGTTKTLAKTYGLDYGRIKQRYHGRKHTKNASYLAYN